MNQTRTMLVARSGMLAAMGGALALAGAPGALADPATAAQPATSSAPAVAPAKVAPITAGQLRQHLEQHPDHMFVLDVRTPQEFAEGHVPGAVNVPHDQVAARLAEVPKDKDVVLYCRSGRRAQTAADTLAAHGYTRLMHLEGDMPGWADSGLPVEK